MQSCIPYILACEYNGVNLVVFACCCFVSSAPHIFWADFKKMKHRVYFEILVLKERTFL